MSEFINLKSSKSLMNVSFFKNETFINDLEDFKFMNSDINSLNALKSLVYNNLGFGIYEEIERVKKAVSNKIAEIYKFDAKDIKIASEVTRLVFEEILKNDLLEIKKILNKALGIAGLTSNDIDIVATTGGSSLIPVIHEQLVEMFGKEKIKKSDTFTSVARGLAIKAQEIYNHSE